MFRGNATYDCYLHIMIYIHRLISYNDLYSHTDIHIMIYGTIMSNQRFNIKLSGKKRRWCNQNNDLSQEGSILSFVLFNVYTNDKPVHNETRSFIYADDLCIATQRSTFEQTETILTEALHNLGEYYEGITCVQIRTKHRHVLFTSRIETQAGS